jgi:hypothetical protein
MLVNLRSFIRPPAVALGASLALTTFAGSVSADVLYQETFDDATLQSNSAQSAGTVAGGQINFTDASATDRARFTVLQDFSSAAQLTFSFKISAPVTQASPATQEVLIRVGPGTTQNTASSTQDVLEAVVFRDGNRGDYANSGNETIFLIANNSATAVDYTNPVTNATASLPALTYASYVRNDTTGVFGVIAGGPTAFQDGDSAAAGTQIDLTRLGIGSATNGNQGTFSLDNIQVLDEISFVNPAPVPEPAALSLIGLGALMTLRRRRPA